MLLVLKVGAVALLAIAGTALSWREVAVIRHAHQLAIRNPGSISEAGFVKVGGVDQWVQIRGEDTLNPVMLILSGGPGMPYTALTPIFKSWERDFTIVMWDRRGVGKTFARLGEAGSGRITFDALANEGIELTGYLQHRLHKRTITLLGHSVGSVLGVLMAQRRPDLFSAYVGTDQIVDMARNEALSYELLVQRVATGGDEHLKREVAAIGPPPYSDVNRWFDKQRLISATDPVSKSFENTLMPMIMTAPGYSLQEVMAVGQGLKFSAASLLHEMMTLDVRTSGMDFKVPFVLIEAENDVLDPTPLALEYFRGVTAPAKQLVVLSGAGHNAVMMKPDVFLAELVRVVRPLADRMPH
ncbi:MAG: proline imino-peptidase [Gemmatimonadetes bacterium]|nr:proline imino-peptidase [Gemmatimonadota bacterium]